MKLQINMKKKKPSSSVIIDNASTTNNNCFNCDFKCNAHNSTSSLLLATTIATYLDQPKGEEEGKVQKSTDKKQSSSSSPSSIVLDTLTFILKHQISDNNNLIDMRKLNLSKVHLCNICGGHFRNTCRSLVKYLKLTKSTSTILNKLDYLLDSDPEESSADDNNDSDIENDEGQEGTMTHASSANYFMIDDDDDKIDCKLNLFEDEEDCNRMFLALGDDDDFLAEGEAECKVEVVVDNDNGDKDKEDDCNAINITKIDNDETMDSNNENHNNPNHHDDQCQEDEDEKVDLFCSEAISLLPSDSDDDDDDEQQNPKRRRLTTTPTQVLLSICTAKGVEQVQFTFESEPPPVQSDPALLFTTTSTNLISEGNPIESATLNSTKKVATVPPPRPRPRRSCPQCLKFFPCKSGSPPWLITSQPLYEDHILVCKSASMTCPICHNPKIHRTILKQHLFTHYSPEEKARRLTCTDCGMNCTQLFKTLKDLDSHHAKVHPTLYDSHGEPLNKLDDTPTPPTATKKTFTCPDCGKLFVSKTSRSLRDHIAIVHLKQTNFMCSICGKPNRKPSALKYHLLTHRGPAERKELPPKKIKEKSLVFCPNCGKSFHSQKAKKLCQNHIDLVHKKQTNYMCHVCGKPNSRLRCLKQHLSTHLGPAELSAIPPKPKIVTEKSFMVCPECGKSFSSTSSGALKYHMDLVHRKMTQYMCQICGKPNASAFQLKKHVRTHLGAAELEELEASEPTALKTSFLCPECGISVSAATTLKHHIERVHYKTRVREKYTCEKCGTVLASITSFRRHLHGHEMEERGELYISCSDCPMKFKFKSELKNHGPDCPGQVHLRPFECLVEGCSKRFKYRHHVVLHLTEYHKLGARDAREMAYPNLPPKDKDWRPPPNYKRKKSRH